MYYLLSHASCIIYYMSENEFAPNPVESVTPPFVAKESSNKGKLIGIIIAIVVLAFVLCNMFMESLIILIVQIAVLINVLKNEIKPILDTTNETINHLRGTTTFLSNNLVEPVLKMNEYSAGLKRFFDILKPSGKSRKSK